MKSFVNTCLLATCFLAAAGQVQATDFKNVKTGESLSDGRLTFGPNTYILPSGDWRVVTHSGRDLVFSNNESAAGPPIGQIVLVSAHEKRVRAVFLLTGTLNSAFNLESWGAEPCKVDKVWFKDETNSRMTHPDCLWAQPHMR